MARNMKAISSGGECSLNQFEMKLMNAGKGLLLLPCSTSELLDVLQRMEKHLQRVQQVPSESMKYAMQPVIKALIAKELLRHPDVDVNISVACCICEVFRIMVCNEVYNDEQMKDFFELVVITFEKLSSTSGGWYTQMNKVFRTLSNDQFLVLMCDLQLDGLIVRLFKQFLTIADSTSPAALIKMKKIMIMIIEKNELLNRELVDRLVTTVREENKIALPVCWKVGGEVLNNCAAQLKPHLPNMVANTVYNYLTETIPSTTHTNKLRKNATHKRELECVEVCRNMVHPVRRRQTKKRKKRTRLVADLPMPIKSVTEVKGKRKRHNTPWKKYHLLLKTVLVRGAKNRRSLGNRSKWAQSVEHGENLVGRRIKVWWPEDEIYYQGAVKSFDCRNKRHKVLYEDGEEELLDLKQEQWELVEMASRLSTFEIKLMDAGKGLLLLPSSTVELLNVLKLLEKLLARVQLHTQQLHSVQQTPSESMKYAMHPVIEALIAKELLRHPDMYVNISVACCISDVLRIMDHSAAYDNEQMKDFLELAVITFEKLSSASGGCYTKLNKVLRALSRVKFSVLECDLRLDGLIVRLFKQFLTVADSNTSGAVLNMRKIMTMIILESEPLNLELVDLLVTSVRKENQITLPVCWQLGHKVLKNCAAQIKPHLPDKVAKKVYNSFRKKATGKRKLKCLNGSGERVQPVRCCKDPTRNTINHLQVHSEDENKHENTRMENKSVTKAQSEEHGENLAGSMINVWSPKDEICYQEVVTSFDCINKRHKVSYDDDDNDKELIDLKGKQWEMLENVSATPDSVGQTLPQCDIICVQGYNVKHSIAPILEAIFMKHGDIAAQCVFKTASVRTYFLEAICEVVRGIESDDVTTIISKMDEVEFQVSEAQAANINVSWLKAHMETIHKTKKTMRKSTLLMETKVNIILVKRAARSDLIEGSRELLAAQQQLVNAERYVKVLDLAEEKPINTILLKQATRIDLNERYRELIAAQEWFVKAERCVKVLDLVEEKLNNNILEYEAEKNSWVKCPII